MTASIRFGLDAVRGVGPELAETIQQHAPYSSLVEFLEKIPANTGVLISLIEAGALDAFGSSRTAMVAALPALVPVVALCRQLRALGCPAPPAGFHVDLSGSDDSLTRLDAEFQALDLYVSGHPVDHYDTRDCLPVKMVETWAGAGERVTLAGLVSSLIRKTSKRGERWAVMGLSDRHSSINVLWFPSSYDEIARICTGEVVAVCGKLSDRDGQIKLIGESIERLERKGPKPVCIYADTEGFDLEDIRTRCKQANTNGSQLHLALVYGNRVTTLLVSPVLQ